MRWRFADKLNDFRPWLALAGTKAVSLEEYNLLEPFGRAGAVPESIVLEACVQVVRWLVSRSSDFEQTCVLSGVEGFAFSGEAGMGDVLEIRAGVLGRTGTDVEIRCEVTCGGRPIARGTVAVSLVPLANGFDRGLVEGTWQELHGKA